VSRNDKRRGERASKASKALSNRRLGARRLPCGARDAPYTGNDARRTQGVYRASGETKPLNPPQKALKINEFP
jgi:hypothetical protein